MECLNCQQPLSHFREPRLRFCPYCGQETNVKPPTVAEFAQQFGGAYFSTEGGLWRTLKLLLTKPGELTRQYLAGRRRHYVLPLRLYLTVSLLVLLLLRALATVALESPKAASFERPKSYTFNLGPGRVGMRDNAFFCEDLPPWACARLQKKLDVDPAALQRQVAVMGERVMGNLGAAMFVLLPAFALALKLVYLNRRMRYTEHLVFALHVHAFWFLMLALTLVDNQWLSLVAFSAVPIYTMLAMRRVYGGRFWPRLARAGVTSVLYLVTLAVALIGLGWWVLLF